MSGNVEAQGNSLIEATRRHAHREVARLTCAPALPPCDQPFSLSLAMRAAVRVIHSHIDNSSGARAHASSITHPKPITVGCPH
jgi:hypothetical protein